jgi:hypothetical protein
VRNKERTCAKRDLYGTANAGRAERLPLIG